MRLQSLHSYTAVFKKDTFNTQFTVHNGPLLLFSYVWRDMISLFVCSAISIIPTYITHIQCKLSTTNIH